MDPIPIANGDTRVIGSPHIDILLDVEDLEEPLLPAETADDIEAQETAARDTVGSLEGPTKQITWPALRRSSVSVRKVSPVSGFEANEASIIVLSRKFYPYYEIILTPV